MARTSTPSSASARARSSAIPGALEALDALAQERLALAAARDGSGGAQGHPERPLAAEGARELDLLRGQP